MRAPAADGRAGSFAHRRFILRRRAWRRRFLWAFPFVVVIPLAVALLLLLIMGAHATGFVIGVAFGGGIGAALALYDSPPAYIENWRIGADGEKATARQLRPLLRQGWTLFNDIDTGHGNIDHVLVGPTGIYLLETKRLHGRVRVQSGALSVRWHEDPDNGYENERIARRARAAAAELRRQLSVFDVDQWVQAIVVLWADFEQRSIMSARVGWVGGRVLASRLAAQPTRYDDEALARVTVAVRRTLHEMRQAVATTTYQVSPASPAVRHFDDALPMAVPGTRPRRSRGVARTD